jgi:hypothetical protein
MRTLQQRLSLAVLKFLDQNKSGTAYATVPTFTGNGTSLAGEIAGDPPVTEPPVPMIACAVNMTRNEELAGVYDVQITLHLKTDGEGEESSRMQAEEILSDLRAVIACPVNTNLIVSDSNREFGMFLSFTNLPSVAPDNRPAYITPIHVYDLREESAPTDFIDNIWHDQIAIVGIAQEMDSHELAEPENEE